MATDMVDIEVSDKIAIATLNNPPVNAMDTRMRLRLVEVFDELSDRKDVSVVILTGAGKIFCAGADLNDRPDPEKAGAFPYHNRITREMLNTIRECAKPVICAVNGAALGGGLALMAHSDIMLASENAVFGMPEIDIGLAGGAAMLHSILPKSKMRLLFFSGDRIPAAELYRMGIIEACVPPEELMAAALKIARNLAGKMPLALKFAKQAANMVEVMPPRDAYRMEQEFTVALSFTEESKEARRVFMEERKRRKGQSKE